MNKKILIFIDWFAPGYKAGGPISSNVNLITHLKDDFELSVITRNTDYTETTPYADIPSDKWVNGYENVKIYYFSTEKLKSRTIQKLIKENNFDIAYINGIYSWYFSILPLWFVKRKGKQIIVSSRGMLSGHALDVKSFKKNLFLFLMKTIGLYKNVIFHATNQKEALEIQTVIGKNGIVKIAPNLPKKLIQVAGNTHVKTIDSINLVSIARIASEKNTLYGLKVLTNIKSNIKIQYDLYGPVYDHNYWEQCQKLISELPENIQVNYQGSIEPINTFKVLQKADFLFQPTNGENFGHTILEALQNGCPIIISDRTPWKNLNEVKSTKNEDKSDKTDGTGVGWDIPLEHPERFVEVIEYCARMGQEEYDAMSWRAFEYAKQVTEDPKVIEANRRLFE
jgi:glycosyltransferase involved in cell wall biosynthesis